ncbi:MAG: NADH-quinone oxidoreductase subunit J, partial [Bradymonadaceae bacterium]
LVTETNGLGETGGAVGPEALGRSLFGPYIVGVVIASFLLTAGLIGAFHLGRRVRELPEDAGERPRRQLSAGDEVGDTS